MIEANFGGVRIDGTNATIIGSGDGNFIADRNGISRVWMDHAFWPLQTVKLYIDQTGDVALLNATAPWFKDAQALRGTAIDEQWREAQGSRQRTADGGVYESSILEHLLVETLTAVSEVGAHGICRLRGADWNDALDMASENGESVAFTAAYAGNLRDLAGLIRLLKARTGETRVGLLKELSALLNGGALHDYAEACRHAVSGECVLVDLAGLADALDARADRLMAFLRKQEWIDAGDGLGWFNSYYDDHGRRVEGVRDDGARMMLIGQVFTTMCGTATDAQIRALIRAADRYLYRKEIGGYRLNTDFHELKFDMGRMFGFAYGEKENGAVFSHMTVMYANALYRRGYAREGWKALRTLADAAMNFGVSRMYPGIPEYFRIDGRGLYSYLTGAASWYLMTMLTQVYGVRGEAGDLVIEPKLVREQFDREGRAAIDFVFAGRRFTVTIANPSGRDYGEYHVGRARLVNGDRALPVSDGRVRLSREDICALPAEGNRVVVELN